ncbi:MAG: hypothetical protein U0169_26980 [Polyangiaceae bacterium]
MRGFLQPCLTSRPTENQDLFRTLSRTRRSKIATAAQTNFLKANQWAKAGKVAPAVAEALEKGVKAFRAKTKK